jgi:hypothetical protein
MISSDRETRTVGPSNRRRGNARLCRIHIIGCDFLLAVDAETQQIRDWMDVKKKLQERSDFLIGLGERLSPQREHSSPDTPIIPLRTELQDTPISPGNSDIGDPFGGHTSDGDPFAHESDQKGFFFLEDDLDGFGFEWK